MFRRTFLPRCFSLVIRASALPSVLLCRRLIPHVVEIVRKEPRAQQEVQETDKLNRVEKNSTDGKAGARIKQEGLLDAAS